MMQRDSARHEAISETNLSQSYSPASSLAASKVALCVGQATLEVSREGQGPVCLRFGDSTDRVLAARASDVTHWCAETSVLLEVTLVVTRGDELEIRTPMLVGEDGRCLAIVRRITDAGSQFELAVAASPSAMKQEVHEQVLSVTGSELQDVLAVLRGAGVNTR